MTYLFTRNVPSMEGSSAQSKILSDENIFFHFPPGTKTWMVATLSVLFSREEVDGSVVALMPILLVRIQHLNFLIATVSTSTGTMVETEATAGQVGKRQK